MGLLVSLFIIINALTYMLHTMIMISLDSLWVNLGMRLSNIYGRLQNYCLSISKLWSHRVVCMASFWNQNQLFIKSLSSIRIHVLCEFHFHYTYFHVAIILKSHTVHVCVCVCVLSISLFKDCRQFICCYQLRDDKETSTSNSIM